MNIHSSPHSFSSLISSLHLLACYNKPQDSKHLLQGPWQETTTCFQKASTLIEKQQPRKLIGTSVLKKSKSQHLSIHLRSSQHQSSFKSLAGLIGNSCTQDSQLCLSKHLPPSTGGCASCFHLLLQGRVMPALEDSRDQKHRICNCTVYKLRGWLCDGNLTYYCQLLPR